MDGNACNSDIRQDSRRRIIGWCLYDWANSAFATVILTAVLPPYFLSIAPDVVQMGPWFIPAESLWSYGLGLSAILTVVVLPVLGAMADAGERRTRYWIVFAILGIMATAITGLLSPYAWPWLIVAFILGQIGFAGANVFYNALLIKVTTPENFDRVSAWGFGAGYVGGGLALGLVLIWINIAPRWGYHTITAIRQGLLFTAGWWFIFGIMSFILTGRLESRRAMDLTWWQATREGWSRIILTFKKIREFRHAFRFLVAFLLYNDGVETTIALAAVFGQRVLGMSTAQLIALILLVQFIAFPGSLLWERVARRWGTGRAIESLLICWIALTTCVWFVKGPLSFYGIGLMFAVILGGIQALSRSFFARIIPAESSAEFFGFYSVTARFSAILGPIWVGLVTQLTGNMRISILGLIIFYIGGLILFRTLPEDIRGSTPILPET